MIRNYHLQRQRPSSYPYRSSLHFITQLLFSNSTSTTIIRILQLDRIYLRRTLFVFNAIKVFVSRHRLNISYIGQSFIVTEFHWLFLTIHNDIIAYTDRAQLLIIASSYQVSWIIPYLLSDSQYLHNDTAYINNIN